MLVVNNNGNSELILESNYQKKEQINAEEFYISFNSYEFEQNYAHEILDFNVSILDEDNHEYKVKKITSQNKIKSIIATHIYYDLIGVRKYDSLQGQFTLDFLANWILQNTGWSFVNVDVTGTRNFNAIGNGNVVELIQDLIKNFDCEVKILPDKRLLFGTRIGSREDKQYRYKSNIESISREIDTSNVRTRIIATGKNGITATYTSPLANNNLFGILDAEPVSNENIDTQEELLEFARKSLNDTPETTIQLSVLDIDGEVGDYVWIIHEGLSLEYESRILSKTTVKDYNQSIVEIGNTVPRTIEDAIINQKQEVRNNKEEAEQAINSLEQKTEEDLAVITDGLSEIRLDVRNTENTLRSEIVQTANSIRLQVEEVDRSVSSLEITADRIQSNITNLENQTNSSITQLSNNINLKVDVGGTISDINLSQGAATINADKINLNGAVIVNGSISGSTDITVNRNAAIGNALYFGGVQGSFDFIEISGGDMAFNSFGDFMFSGGDLYVNGRRVVTE